MSKIALRRDLIMNRFSPIALCLGLTIPLGLWAEPLTLETARELALRNSPSLGAYIAALDVSVLEEKKTGYGSLPSIALSGTLSASASENVSLRDTLTSGVTASVSQTLWDGGRQTMAKDIAGLETESARQSARSAYLQVLQDVDTAWYDLLESHASLGAAEKALEGSELRLSIAKLRFETGSVSSIELLEAEADLESNRTALSQARGAVAVGTKKLAHLTGRSVIGEMQECNHGDLAFAINTLASYAEEDIDSLGARFLSHARSVNPSLSRSNLALRMAEQNVRLAAAEYAPKINAGLSGGLSRSATDNSLNGKVSLSLGGSLSLDWWTIATSVDGAKASVRKAGFETASEEETLSLEVYSAVHDCVILSRSVLSGEKALEYSKKLYEAKLELFKLQSASVSDLSDAADLVRTNEVQLISARYGLLTRLSDLRTLGGFDTDVELWGILK
jgi:outer membrane protein TolC